VVLADFIFIIIWPVYTLFYPESERVGD